MTDPLNPYWDNLTNKALREVKNERIRQRKLWGNEQRHNLTTWTTIVEKQVKDLAQKVSDYKVNSNTKSLDAVQTEAVQVAAIAIALAEAIDDKLGLEAYAND